MFKDLKSLNYFLKVFKDLEKLIRGALNISKSFILTLLVQLQLRFIALLLQTLSLFSLSTFAVWYSGDFGLSFHGCE